MNIVRKRILEKIEPYLNFAEHKDLIAFCVCDGYLCYDAETDTDPQSDFNELVVVVEKDWLFNLMKEDGITNPLDYLQNEYTSDDSIYWFDNAVIQRKVVMVNFN